MRSKKLFLKIYIPILIIYSIFIIVFSILAIKANSINGYIDSITFNEELTIKINNIDYDSLINIENKSEYLLTNENITNYVYNFRVEFYDKVYRKSDIYDIKLLKDSLPEYITDIKLLGRLGIIFSQKQLDSKIDNIKYNVMVRNVYFISLIPLLIILLAVLFGNKISEIIKSSSEIIKSSKIYNINISLNISIFIILGYLFLIIPYCLFVITWTKYYISIPLIIILLITMCIIVNDATKNFNDVFNLNLFILLTIILIIISFVIISGIGEIFPQSGDMKNGRNAMMRDLVNFSWPLIYPKNGYGFVYYFAHWVIPSLIGKIFGLNIGLFSLILWTSLGIFIFYILLLNLLKVKSNLYKLIFIIIFIFFSVRISDKMKYHIFTEYMPIMTQSYQIFNQSIAIWVMCILFLYQRNSSNFAFLGLSVVFYSPYAIIGILPYMFIKVILDIKNNKFIELKNIFSISNILSSVSIFPLIYLYLSSASTVNDGFKSLITEYNYFVLFISYIVSFGIYMIFLFKDNKNNYILYTTIFVFIFVSMVKYSNDHNFSRTNLTAIFFTYFMSVKYLNENINLKSIKKKLFILLIIISSFSSFIYFENQIIGFLENRTETEKYEERETFNTSYNSWVLRTITCQDMDNSIFFKYIAKDIE